MNRQLSAAVIISFRYPDAAQIRRQLSRFSARQWQQAFPWLDASGLALYLLDWLRSHAAEDAIPDSVMERLEQRHADNEQRTTTLFVEFARINAAFRASGMEYANLKGFTLVPDYCPDLSLRCQMDFDFLVDAAQAEPCVALLRTLGYSLMTSNAHVMEFKSHAGRVPHIRDLYKPRPQRAVEIHLCDDAGIELQSRQLRHSRMLGINGIDVAALTAEDMFLGQASHLFRHVRSEWTRVSWLLEFRHFVICHRTDAKFWLAVERKAMEAPGASLAVGVALHLAERAFGMFAPRELRDWSAARLPASVALWIERYGDEVLLASFPGSKLYLILERELDSSRKMSSTIRRRLLPMRTPARVTSAASGGVGERFRAFQFQLRYFLFRLRFHFVHTPRYLWEAWRWRRFPRSSDGLGDALLRTAPPRRHRSARQDTRCTLPIDR